MMFRTLMAAALATALAGAMPANAQTAPQPAQGAQQQGAQQQGTQHPGTPRPGSQPTPGAHPAAPATGHPTPMPQLTFEQIVGDISPEQTFSPTAIGIGAIAGVIVFNIVAPGLFPATYALGGPLVGTIAAESAIAASRVYTVTSAVIGGWTGQWIYANWLAR